MRHRGRGPAARAGSRSGRRPMTTTSSPGPTPASSCPLSTQASGSATRTPRRSDSPSGMRLSPSTRQHGFAARSCTRRTRRRTGSPSTPGSGIPSGGPRGSSAQLAARDRGDHLHPVARRPSRSTSPPTSTISPAISCPITLGGSRRWWPCAKIFTSVPQVEQCLHRRTCSSRGPGAGLGTSLQPTSPGPWNVAASSSAGALASRLEHVVRGSLGRPQRFARPVRVHEHAREAGRISDVLVAADRDRDADAAPACRPSPPRRGTAGTRARRGCTWSAPTRRCRAGCASPRPTYVDS